VPVEIFGGPHDASVLCAGIDASADYLCWRVSFGMAESIKQYGG